MATIVKKTNSYGEISYKFRAYLGKDSSGKQITRYTTWIIPDNLSPSKAEKAARKAADEWEKQIKAEYEDDLLNPERIKIREIQNKRTDFSDFISNVWFPLCIEDGSHKHTTVNFYRYTMKRVITYFQGQYLQDISSIDIRKFLNYLRTEYKSKSGTPLSDKSVKHTYCMLVLIFNFAKEQELIITNPMDKVSCPKLAKKKVTAFSQKEAVQFLNAVPKYPLDYQCILRQGLLPYPDRTPGT